MEVILKEILAKLERLESDVAQIKAEVQKISAQQKEPEKLSILEQARRDKPLYQEAFDRLAKQLGIEDMEPIGAKKMRELMIADGIKPEDNEFSRGIIAMREE